MPARGGRPDKLQVQVAVKIKAPRGAKIAKKVMDQILYRLANNRPMPKNIEVRGVFWRNPQRKGRLSEWRYHSGADLSALQTEGFGVESRPRGSLRDAVATLGPFIESGRVTF